jgi:3-hydroxyacyl-CoA dehydrogenase
VDTGEVGETEGFTDVVLTNRVIHILLPVNQINAHSVATIEMLDDMVSKGLLGRKSGEGFFKYER